jgi:hypothetical protein
MLSKFKSLARPVLIAAPHAGSSLFISVRCDQNVPHF